MEIYGKERIRIGVIIPLVFFMLTLVPASGSTFRKVKSGEPVPPFTLKDISGADFSFSPEDGNLKVLTFVKLSQERSRKLLSDLNEIAGEVSEKGVKVVAVVSYEDKAEDVKAFIEDKKISFPVVIDPEKKTYGEYGLFVLPATAIVGGDGKLLFEFSSYDMEFKNTFGGKVKVIAGMMTEEDYKKMVNPPEGPEKTSEQREASRDIMLGEKLAARGMHARAAEKFKKAAELDPENLRARTLYAEALARSGSAEEAVKELEGVLEKNPNFREAKIGMGIALIEMGDFDGAVTRLTDASMLNPRPQRAYYWLGYAYEKKGDLENAVKYYRKALKKLLGE